MNEREHRETMLLGFIFGAIVSMVLVLGFALYLGMANNPESIAVASTAEEDDTVVASGSGPGSGGPGTDRPFAFGSADEDILAAFAAGGCDACHSIKGVGGAGATIGPPLFRTGAIAADRRPGPTVDDYIRTSIVDPDAFTMPNCPTGPCTAGLMPKTFSDTLTNEQIDLIVGYLSVLGTASESSVLSP